MISFLDVFEVAVLVPVLLVLADVVLPKQVGERLQVANLDEDKESACSASGIVG